MSSGWPAVDEGDTVARRGHAMLIAGVAQLLDGGYPALSLIGMLSTRRQVLPEKSRAWVREAEALRERPDLAEASARGELSDDQIAALCVLAEPGDDGAWVEALASPVAADRYVGPGRHQRHAR